MRPYATMRHGVLLTCIVAMAVGISAGPAHPAQARPRERNNMTITSTPLLTTSARLLKLGESIELRLSGIPGANLTSLRVFPRYLEQAKPGRAFRAGGDLNWVNRLPSEQLTVRLAAGGGAIRYTPRQTGNYLAVLHSGDVTLTRYFAVVDDEYTVLSFSPFCPLEPDPTLHATGIPLDYRIPADRIRADDPLCARLLGYNRSYGDSVIPILPDTPALSHAERVAQYGQAMSRTRALLPDPADGRSAWIECNHELDPGYARALAEVGVNDHCGLWCANAKPWLGMPEFPYFTSPTDCRKPAQAPSAVVSHQWDFCGSWHFLGPVSWHFKVSEGDWAKARKCMLTSAAEISNLARMSGHPAFVNPLYEALDVGIGYPNPDFETGVGEPRNFAGLIDEPFLMPRAMSAAEIADVSRDGIAKLKGAVAAWTFDGSGPTVTDLSGNGRHGQLANGARRAPGVRGQALELDGKAGCVIVPPGVGTDTRDFTIGCWVRPAAQQRQWANILSSHNTGGGPFRGISFEQESDQHNRFRLIAGSGDGWFCTEGVQLVANEWQHLVAVRQGRSVTLYLNGRPVVHGETPTEAPFPSATDGLRMGDWVRGVPDAGRRRAFEAFIDRYQRFLAFELPKKQKVVFARSVDVADYYRRHFPTTPRTLFVSKTDHVMYDIWWTYQWDMARYFLVTRERLPWLTRVSKVPRIGYKDPLSYEFILVEEGRWSIRFERECPNPIWRFDYSVQTSTPAGSAVARTDTPDVHIPAARWERQGADMVLKLTLRSDTPFTDYAIAVWGLPKEIRSSPLTATNTKECLKVRNTDGEEHAVLFLDLKPNMQIELRAGGGGRDKATRTGAGKTRPE